VDAGGGVQSQRGSIVEKILLSVQKFCKLHFFATTFPKLNATRWNLVNLHFRTCAKLQKINQYDQISIYVVCRRVVMQIWKHWAVLGCGGFRAKARNSGQSQYSHVPNGQICIRSAVEVSLWENLVPMSNRFPKNSSASNRNLSETPPVKNFRLLNTTKLNKHYTKVFSTLHENSNVNLLREKSNLFGVVPKSVR